MFRNDQSAFSNSLISGMVITILFSLFEVEAEAARRRGRGGVRRPQGRVRVAVRRRGNPVRRVVRRNVVRNVNRNLAVLPANGQAANINGQNVNLNNIQDFGPASVNPVALGLGGVNGLGIQPLPGFASIGVGNNGQFFELNPGSVVNGQIVNQNLAVRQPIVGFNGSLVVGQDGQLLSGAQQEIQMFNQGVVPVQSFALRNGGSFGGVSQVRSLRR